MGRRGRRGRREEGEEGEEGAQLRVSEDLQEGFLGCFCRTERLKAETCCYSFQLQEIM